MKNQWKIVSIYDDFKFLYDQVIKTMMDTGKDMQEIYKETAQGGLAVNVVEC